MNQYTYKIFPAIGVARVGNSETDYYIAPEVPGGLPTTIPEHDGEHGPEIRPKDFRDKSHKIVRQAARFRIYRYPAGGGPAEEVIPGTDGVKNVHWVVHLANKKASWYETVSPHDLHGYPSNRALRNRLVENRQALILDPGPRYIAWSKPESFPDPRFDYDLHHNLHLRLRNLLSDDGEHVIPVGPKTLHLGELKVDRQGRLLVLGGQGEAYSPIDDKVLLDSTNNDLWWDDISDGPVRAIIELENGGWIEATPAWVVVGPPRYAPGIQSLVTMYDVILDVMVRHRGLRPEIVEDGQWKRGKNGYWPDFATEIEPIFRRAGLMRWVVPMPHKPHEFDWRMLADPSRGSNGYRARFVNALRAPGMENTLVSPATGVTMMPYLAGDDPYGTPSESSSKYLRLTDTQYFFLEQWAKGYFRGDAAPPADARPGTYDPKDPGQLLTRAALEQCLGGGLAPGIELSWICRDPAIYGEPFRIKCKELIDWRGFLAERGPDFVDSFPSMPQGQLSLGFDPAGGMEPGDLTRYQAVPWHADFNLCTVQWIGERPLWWWPSHRPTFVHRKHDGDFVLEPWIGESANQTAPNYTQFKNSVRMIEEWWKLGFVYDVNRDSKMADGPRFVEVASHNPNPYGK